MTLRPAFPLALSLVTAPLAAQRATPDFSRPVWRSPVEFTSAFSLRELADGRLIVSDPGEREIHLLDPRGRSLGTIGRPGGGPQEFAMPVWTLPQPGDSTLVVDRDQERFLLIGPDGKAVRTIPWPRIAGSGLRNVVRAQSDGRVVFTEDGLPRPGLTSTPLLRWDRSRGTLDTIATLATPGVVRYTMTYEGREAQATRALPYADGDGWAVGPAGEIAVIRPERYVVEWYLPDGRHVIGGPITAPRLRVTDADRARSTEGENPATVAHLTFPEYKPPVRPGMAMIAPGGELWVRRTEAPGDSVISYDRIDRNGRRVDTIRLPRRRMLIGFGRALTYLMHTDEDDVQHLEAYR
ncbi:MAG TPA: hypothetical protein VG940_05045 [Gemmatimonadales bacterium]|nr:hypothetical protein [Gemmatimonadales bacterium]